MLCIRVVRVVTVRFKCFNMREEPDIRDDRRNNDWMERLIRQCSVSVDCGLVDVRILVRWDSGNENLSEID